ncbi:MAG: hypothetical protein ACKO0V_00080 [bacterium]
MAGRHAANIECEQAIYGSFPFWDKGYALLAASDGCQKSWLDEFIRLCRSLGQPPGEASPEIDSLLFASPLSSGQWVVALGSAQGCDDRGRPGAWAFHALFLSRADYRRAGASPFAFETCFRKRFQKEISLEKLAIEIATDKSHFVKSNSATIHRTIINTMKQSKRIRILDENTSINSFREFWCVLPEKIRLARSITTMSFRHHSDFDIAAMKPAAWPTDLAANRHEITAMTFQEIFAPVERSPARPIIPLQLPKWHLPKRTKRIGVIVSLFVLCLAGLINCNFHSSERPVETRDISSSKSDEPPAPLRFQALPEKPDLTHAVHEELIDMAERLHLEIDAKAESASQIAARVAAAMRYQGPLVAQKIDSGKPGSQQATQMDKAIRRFSEMKPWPTSEDSSPSARLALANLAWVAGLAELSEKAVNLDSRSDVQDWFDQFNRLMIPPDIEKMLIPTGLEAELPELVEYRLHLIRISEIAIKE